MTAFYRWLRDRLQPTPPPLTPLRDRQLAELVRRQQIRN